MDGGTTLLALGTSCLVAMATYLFLGTEQQLRVRAIALKSRFSRRVRTSASALRSRIKGGALQGTSSHAPSKFMRARADKARRQACLAQMPEMVDVVVLGLTAGVSFDAALELYCSRYQTLLASELAGAMRSWKLGFKTRRQALEELAQRLGVEAFSTFVATVNESIEFGSPLADALVEQGEAVRAAHRSQVQERIEKAPVKMLVPVGTMVLPAMLLAILGPMLSAMVHSV